MNFSQPKLNLSDLKQSYNGWSDWTTWNVALWINNDECFYNIAKECKNYADFLYEMQAMIGSFATPDGADWGEANIEEMNEVIMESNINFLKIWGLTFNPFPLSLVYKFIQPL